MHRNGEVPIAVVYAKRPRRDRPMLWADLHDLATAGMSSATQYNRIGKMVTRHWVWNPNTALRFTQDYYTLRWFARDHAAQYCPSDGIGLRVWDQGRLTPWKDLPHR